MVIKKFHNGQVWKINIGEFLSWLIVTIIVLCVIGIEFWWVALLYGIRIPSTED